MMFPKYNDDDDDDGGGCADDNGYLSCDFKC